VTEVVQRRVIVCADDFAVHQSASLGIAKLARAGRLSATSAMVLSPRWSADVAVLRELRGQIDVGLHLDWTSPFARDAGHGLSLGAAMWRALRGGFARDAARAVIEHQLDAFEAQWGAPPDFVDGHQHVQQFDGIRQTLLEVLARRYGGLATRPYLRVSRASGFSAGLKGRIITAMGADALVREAAAAQLPTARALWGIYDFTGNAQRYATLMPRWLRQMDTGDILMCHPAQAAEPDDEIGLARAQEFGYLFSPDFAQALQHARVRPARGAQALASAAAPAPAAA